MVTRYINIKCLESSFATQKTPKMLQDIGKLCPREYQYTILTRAHYVLSALHIIRTTFAVLPRLKRKDKEDHFSSKVILVEPDFYLFNSDNREKIIKLAHKIFVNITSVSHKNLKLND
jgi:hypothetical protein